MLRCSPHADAKSLLAAGGSLQGRERADSSRRCPSARQLNPGRCSTYRGGNLVQMIGAASLPYGPRHMMPDNVLLEKILFALFFTILGAVCALRFKDRDSGFTICSQSITASMSLAGSRFSSESAPRLFHLGFRGRRSKRRLQQRHQTR
jgi:hypothetical protein